MLVAALLNLAVGYGFWTLQPWAWLVGIITQGLDILGALGDISSHGLTFQTLVKLVLAAAILYYLFTPHVRRAFGRG